MRFAADEVHDLRSVALVVASYSESIESFRGHLIAALQQHSIEVHVAAPGLDADSLVRARLEARGVIVHDLVMQRAGMNPVSDIMLVARLCRLMFLVKPSIWLGYTAKPVIYGAIGASLMGVPRRFALITGLGYAFTASRKGLSTWLVRWLYTLGLFGATKVFFQNPDDENVFRKLEILRSATPSFVVNGSGVDLDEFKVAPLPAGPPAFLMISRLLGDKGVREYAEAARRIRARHPGTRFLLVGWIDENPDAISIEELNQWTKDGSLEFLGKLTDVRPAIAKCTAYVLPSYREGTPRTVLEAMAMGRAVITTDAPGCRQTVRNGENGFLVPIASADALESAMEKIINEPELAVSMGRASRARVEIDFDVHRVNQSILAEMGIN